MNLYQKLAIYHYRGRVLIAFYMLMAAIITVCSVVFSDQSLLEIVPDIICGTLTTFALVPTLLLSDFKTLPKGFTISLETKPHSRYQNADHSYWHGQLFGSDMKVIGTVENKYDRDSVIRELTKLANRRLPTNDIYYYGQNATRLALEARIEELEAQVLDKAK